MNIKENHFVHFLFVLSIGIELTAIYIICVSSLNVADKSF